MQLHSEIILTNCTCGSFVDRLHTAVRMHEETGHSIIEWAAITRHNAERHMEAQRTFCLE